MNELRPKDWSGELSQIKELTVVPGMTISRLLRIVDIWNGPLQFQRDKNVVNSEAAKWFKWRTNADGVPMFRVVPMAGFISTLPTSTSAEMVQQDVINLAGPNTTTIVELGCGFARHLLGVRDALEHRFPNIDYYGCDLSPTALEVSRAVANLEPERRNVSFHAFNYLEPDFSFLAGKTDVIFFSCHSIEQVEHIGEAVFHAMIKAAPRVVGVHHEPFAWQRSPEAEVGLNATFGAPVDDGLGGSMPKKMSWNADLLEVLQTLNSRGTIKLDPILFNACGEHLYNPTSIAIWHKP